MPGAFDWDSKAEADERVRWPLEFQWFGEPNGQLLVSRHAKPRTPIPANGRLFIFGESHITALDAYNGAELWRRRLSVGVCTGQQPVSADDQYLYVQDGGLDWQLDALTGRHVKAYGKRAGPVVHSLQKPLNLTASGKQGDAGTITIAHENDGLTVTLTTVSPRPAGPTTPCSIWERTARSRTSACQFRSKILPGTGPGKPRRKEMPKFFERGSPFRGRRSRTPAFSARVYASNACAALAGETPRTRAWRGAFDFFGGKLTGSRLGCEFGPLGGTIVSFLDPRALQGSNRNRQQKA